jgi:hypothetical protein
MGDQINTVVLRDSAQILHLKKTNASHMIMCIVVLKDIITVTMKANVFQILFLVVMVNNAAV